MIIAKHEKIVWKEVEMQEWSGRGDGGLGHTGAKKKNIY